MAWLGRWPTDSLHHVSVEEHRVAEAGQLAATQRHHLHARRVVDVVSTSGCAACWGLVGWSAHLLGEVLEEGLAREVRPRALHRELAIAARTHTETGPRQPSTPSTPALHSLTVVRDLYGSEGGLGESSNAELWSLHQALLAVVAPQALTEHLGVPATTTWTPARQAQTLKAERERRAKLEIECGVGSCGDLPTW